MCMFLHMVKCDHDLNLAGVLPTEWALDEAYKPFAKSSHSALPYIESLMSASADKCVRVFMQHCPPPLTDSQNINIKSPSSAIL